MSATAESVEISRDPQFQALLERWREQGGRPPEGVRVRIVCLSDTHGSHRWVTVPDGDLFLFAGDLSRHGKFDEVEDFDRWLGGLPHRHKGVDRFTGHR